MSVRRQKRRDPKTGAVREFWMIDVDIQHPDGRRERVRKVAPVQTRRDAEQYERDLRRAILDGSYGKKEEVAPEPPTVPTVEEFHKEFMSTYVANNNKVSEQTSKRSMFKCHILPLLGDLRLDEVAPRVEDFKRQLREERQLSPKRINNVLTVLGRMLHYAADEREIITKAPRMRYLKLLPPKTDFLDFDEYRRLVDAARAEPEWLPAVLVGGDAGLRMGEIIALEWADVDFASANLTVRRADYRGTLSSPKSGRDRTIPMTQALQAALREHRHLRGRRIFLDLDGEGLTHRKMERALHRLCKRAGLRKIGWHTLRHTFCSHLAMRGAPPKAIQELAGHTEIKTTQRYLHLAPGVLRETVALLDRRPGGVAGGVSSEETVERQPDGNGASPAAADLTDSSIITTTSTN